MLIVGLTGSIATGKSTVSLLIKQKLGIPVVDADLIAKQVVEKGQPAYHEIVDYFSRLTDNILLENGELNRAVLGKLVFGEENKVHLKKLNSITHPKIGRKMVEQVVAAYIKGWSVVVLDVPLLFEAGFCYYCGVVVNVTCDKKKQLERLLARNKELTKRDASNRIESQLAMEVKSQYSDYIVENNGTLQELEDKVRDVFDSLKPSAVRTLVELTPLAVLFGGVQYWRNCKRFKPLSGR